MHDLGHTRATRRLDHLLQTPDSFVRTPLPEIARGTAIVHAGPAVGARFTQYTVELQPGGTLNATGTQRFLYVLDGDVRLFETGRTHALTAGGYAYIPEAGSSGVEAVSAARFTVIEKPYVPLAETPPPPLLVGREKDLVPTSLEGDDALRVRALLPADIAFDFAVNTMTYAPGAALAQVEMHVMEHGLLMLEGGGVYRLSDHWYPVKAGDYIWMAPFCPQWFGALGKVPAKYLIYKDANRTSNFGLRSRNL